MKRALNIKNLYDKKTETFVLDGIWQDVLDEPERAGPWLIWGPEKNGKTTFALMLADYLSRKERVLYLSAEEGLSENFKKACQRVHIGYSKKGLLVLEYESLEEIRARLSKKQAPRIIFIDNLTVYADEIRRAEFQRLLHDYPRVLFVYLAHEDRKEPSPAIARFCKKLAKVIMHVQGLAVTVSGRCPGGKLTIDEDQAALFHGHHLKKA